MEGVRIYAGNWGPSSNPLIFGTNDELTRLSVKFSAPIGSVQLSDEVKLSRIVWIVVDTMKNLGGSFEMKKEEEEKRRLFLLRWKFSVRKLTFDWKRGGKSCSYSIENFEKLFQFFFSFSFILLAVKTTTKTKIIFF